MKRRLEISESCQNVKAAVKVRDMIHIKGTSEFPNVLKIRKLNGIFTRHLRSFICAYIFLTVTKGFQ